MPFLWLASDQFSGTSRKGAAPRSEVQRKRKRVQPYLTADAHKDEAFALFGLVKGRVGNRLSGSSNALAKRCVVDAPAPL